MLSVTPEALQAFATKLETDMPPVGVIPNVFTSVTVMSDYVVDLEKNMPPVGVQTHLAITVEEIQKFKTLVDAAVHPTVGVTLSLPQQAGVDGGSAITPLITSINSQIRSETDGFMREGATVAQIIMAGLSAYLKGQQQSAGGEQAATPLAGALMTNVSAQFGATQNMFYAIGFGPAAAVESGFKGYSYTGLSSGLLDGITSSIRADAENYMQRGATIAGYVQAGMAQQFSAESGVRSAISAGAAWGSAFMQGVFGELSGAGFVDQISTQVIDGITGELEQP